MFLYLSEFKTSIMIFNGDISSHHNKEVIKDGLNPETKAVPCSSYLTGIFHILQFKFQKIIFGASYHASSNFSLISS
jgi:hypothetical protein